MKADVKDVARYLRMGRHVPEGALAARIEELIAVADGETCPACTWRRFTIENGAVGSGELRMKISSTLARHLGECRDVYLVCGTLGARFDAFQRRVAVRSGADALIVQAIGAALVEDLVDVIEDEIRAELAPGETLIQRYSPGFGDFSLEAQRAILTLLDTSRRIGVSLTDTLLMVPSKSVSAVIGVEAKCDAPFKAVDERSGDVI